MKTFKLLAIFGIILVGATSCNTVDGIGQDLKSGGDTLQDAAN